MLHRNKHRRIIGIDPGSEESGFVVLEDSNIRVASNLSNVVQLYDKICNYQLCEDLTIVIEDIRPYSLRLTPQVIDTCKFIGELVYRLKIECGLCVAMVNRSEVKKWCFDSFPEVCVPIIDKMIAKKGYVSKNGEQRKASFVFVNDKIVTECMKYLYKIPLPKAGKGYDYGLQTHSWQALAVASYYSANFDKIQP